MELPYEPPLEYDFHAELHVSQSEPTAWGQLFPKNGAHCVLTFSDGGRKASLSAGAAAGVLTRDVPPLPTDFFIDVRVRKDRLTVELNGTTTLFDVPTDFTKIDRRVSPQIGGTGIGLFGAARYVTIRILEISGPGRMRAHAVDDPELLRTFHSDNVAVASVAFSPDGQFVLSAPVPGNIGYIQTWQVEPGRPSVKFEPTDFFSFAPSAQSVLSSAGDSALAVHDLKVGLRSAVVKLADDDGSARFAAWAPDNASVAVGCRRGRLRLLDPAVFPAAKDLAEPFITPAVAAGAYGPEGDRIAVADDAAGRLVLYDVRQHRPLWQADCEQLPVRRIAFSPAADRILAMLERSDNVWVFDAADGRVVARCPHAHPVRDAEFSPDGRRVFTADAAGLHCWELAAPGGGERTPFFDAPGPVNGLAVARVDHRLLAACADQTVRLFDTDTGRQLHRFTGHDKPVNCVAFAPDEQTAASGGEDRTVRIWRLGERGAPAAPIDPDEPYLRGLGVGVDVLVEAGGAVRRFTLNRPIPTYAWPRLAILMKDAGAVAFTARSGTAAATTRVAALSKLRAVTLAGPEVTDAVVAPLGKSATLREIHLIGTSVTPAAAEALEHDRPGLTVRTGG
jgi:WD40 repeat protein